MNRIKQLGLLISGLIFLISTYTFAQNEDSSSLLGENFSLEAALHSFKDANNLEIFEESINRKENHINNLDLNGDHKVDYVTVNDYNDGDIHVIVLSVLIDQDEVQDIATIEIEKDGPTSAKLQIIGHEDLYGQGMYIEPYDIEGQDSGNGPSVNMAFEKIVLNVWYWPSVRYIFGPRYVVYRSPWRWSFFPSWWAPYRPRVWSTWNPFRIRYTSNYRITPVRRVTNARIVYAPQRRVSRTVVTNHKTSVVRARTTNVKSRSTVVAAKGSKGQVVAVKKTGVKTNNNSVKSYSKTKVKATNGQKVSIGSKKLKTVKKKSVKRSSKVYSRN